MIGWVCQKSRTSGVTGVWGDDLLGLPEMSVMKTVEVVLNK
jgi:hypothetical protein